MPQKQPIKLIRVVSLKSLECLWVSIEINYNLTNTRQLTVRVRIRQISFLGHITRLSDGELVKDYALYNTPRGKKKQGRPQRL